MSDKAPIRDLPSVDAGLRFLNDPAFRQLLNTFVLPRKAKEQDKFVKELVKCSKRDLRASRILYREGDFPNAVYHLQQSVEKLTKAYAVDLSILSKEEAVEARHYSPKVYFQMVGRKWAEPMIVLAKYSYPAFDEAPYRGLKGTIKEYNKLSKRIELARMSAQEIKATLHISDAIEKAMSSITDTLPKAVTMMSENMPGIREATSKVADQEVPLDAIKEAIDRVRAVSLKEVAKYTSFLVLYLLSTLTYCHATFTRYPDGEIGPSDYTPSLGIVASISSVWALTERAMSPLAGEAPSSSAVRP